MADAGRARKIADRIKTLTAENLDSIVKDPDLGFVTITDVRVTGDLQHASLFYTVFGDAAQRAQTARLLELNKGKLRSFVGKQLGIRLTPSLEFIADAIPETTAHLEDLLKEAKEHDAQVAAAAAGAVHAGEADPYKKAREDDEEPEGDEKPEGDEPRTEEPGGSPAEPTPDGILVVDKPQGWTSHDVVARARRLCATRKVGHAGTLDPMATGVLVLGVGRATRLLTFLVGCDKDYAATVRLGQATLTDDAEGEVISARGAAGIDRDAVVAAASALTGEIEQVPSAVSAIKVKGERAYHRVRAGEQVELAARPVTVARFAVGDVRTLEVDGTRVLDVDVEVTVSSGTYVRALARDLGAALGCDGHLTMLRRTRVGGFGLDAAHPLADLEARQGEAMPVTPLADAARAAFVVREVDEADARTLGFGQRLASAVPGRAEPVAAIAPDGTLVAMLDESGPTARSLVVFSPATS